MCYDNAVQLIDGYLGPARFPRWPCLLPFWASSASGNAPDSLSRGPHLLHSGVPPFHCSFFAVPNSRVINS